MKNNISSSKRPGIALHVRIDMNLTEKIGQWLTENDDEEVDDDLLESARLDSGEQWGSEDIALAIVGALAPDKIPQTVANNLTKILSFIAAEELASAYNRFYGFDPITGVNADGVVEGFVID